MLSSPGSRILQLCRWLATAAPRVGLLWGYTYNSFDEWERPTNQKKSIFLTTALEVASVWVQLRHHQSLTAVDRYRHDDADPRARAVAEDSCEHVDDKQDAWLVIPFVRLFRDDRRSLNEPTLQKALWCWGCSILLSVVHVEFINGRNRSRSQKHDFVSKFLNAENFLRVQRQVRALKCEPALPTKAAKQQPQQPQSRKPSARDVMRAATIAV